MHTSYTNGGGGGKLECLGENLGCLGGSFPPAPPPPPPPPLDGTLITVPSFVFRCVTVTLLQAEEKEAEDGEFTK